MTSSFWVACSFAHPTPWQYFHTWINGHTRMSLGKYWKTEYVWWTSWYSRCVTREHKNTCVRLDWLTEFEAFDCSIIHEKGKQDCYHICTSVMPWWELIHMTIRLRYSGIIDIIVSVYNCIKVLNRLASERYFLTLETQLIWISTFETELLLDFSYWRSSWQIAPRTNPVSLFIWELTPQGFAMLGTLHKSSFIYLCLDSSFWTAFCT
jgi:hypothetical protein